LRRWANAIGSLRKYAPRPQRGFVPAITLDGDRDMTVHAVNSEEIVAAAAMAEGVALDVAWRRDAAAPDVSIVES